MVQAEQHVTQVPRVPLGRTGITASILGMGCSPLGHSYGVGPLLKATCQVKATCRNTKLCAVHEAAIAAHCMHCGLWQTGQQAATLYYAAILPKKKQPVSHRSACVGVAFVGVVLFCRWLMSRPLSRLCTRLTPLASTSLTSAPFMAQAGPRK